MLAIIDYGVGNLFSLQCSLKKIGVDAVVTKDAQVIKDADRIILPGVGAFGDAAEKLNKSGLGKVLCEQAKNGKPIMGICLGMQLFFDESEESPGVSGLGILKGKFKKIPKISDIKIPHIGWNSLEMPKQSRILKDIGDEPYVYFVHSYYVENCDDSLLATTEYGNELTAAVASGNVYGCQFHPEKSGSTGLNILKAFCEME